ncbi:cytochrome b/b6 domain-containing protein [uncultured Alsobacter sp.]|uniref:cytochrome b n=1 Tax=uncultured Alsobacter sp. TaxID=1748258 RepID=UPI0025CCE7EA|nr:cytochrome b/b6 domain-containing protein [uncultured Alsobacter sp.]
MTDVVRLSTPSRTQDGYTPAARVLHWTMAALIPVAFILGLTVDVPPRAYENAMVQAHMLVGLTLALLLVVRIVSRLSNGVPAPEPGSGRLAARLAGSTHLVLYLLLIILPLTGLFVTFYRGRPIELGLFTVFSPLETNRALSKSIRSFHKYFAFALIGLAVLHAGAAFWHHKALRDGTLRRMWPSR